MMRGVLLFIIAFVVGTNAQTRPAEVIYRTTGGYVYCSEIDLNTDLPVSCTETKAESDLFPLRPDTSSSARLLLRKCGGTLYVYNLFLSSVGSNIARSPITVTGNTINTVSAEDSRFLLLTGGSDVVRTFDISCRNVFYPIGADIFVQNLDVTEDGTIIRKRLYTASADIQHLQVGSQIGNFIYFSINNDGMYRINFDGEDEMEILTYDSLTIVDLDYNPSTGTFVLATTDAIYYFGESSIYPGFVAAELTGGAPVLAIKPSAPAEPVNTVSVGSESSNVHYILASFSVNAASNPTRVFIRSVTNVIDTELTTDPEALDLFVCARAEDCVVACDIDDCECLKTDSTAACCNGLCVDRDSDGCNPNEFSCFCRMGPSGDCAVSNGLFTLPPTCPVDIIGAVTCHYSRRGDTFSLYALSQTAQTKIRREGFRGKELPLPDDAKRVFIESPSVGYKFLSGRGPSGRASGSRYGRYVASLDTGGGPQTLDIIVQERNNARYSKYITVSAEVGTEAVLRLWIARPCDIRRVRWRIGKKNLNRYKGKASLTFNPVALDDAGLYESYFVSRLKTYSITFVRLIVYTPPTTAIPCFEGGVPSSSGLSCICPPSRIGNCFNSCPKGMFGTLGVCTFTCADDLDSPDCSYVLFCMEDPLGCECYPGFQLPDCRPCQKNYFGQNCEEKCTCSDCDPFDGSCP